MKTTSKHLCVFSLAALALGCGESHSNSSAVASPPADASVDTSVEASPDATIEQDVQAEEASTDSSGDVEVDAGEYVDLTPGALELSSEYAVVSSAVFGMVGLENPRILLDAPGKKYNLCLGGLCNAHVPVGKYTMSVWDAGVKRLESEVEFLASEFMFLSIAHHHKLDRTAFSLFSVDLSAPPVGQWRVVLNNLVLADESTTLDFWTLQHDPSVPGQTPLLRVEGLEFGAAKAVLIEPYFSPSNPGAENYFLAALPHGTSTASANYLTRPGCRHWNVVIVDSVFCDTLDPSNHDPEGPCHGSAGGSWLILPQPVGTFCEDSWDEMYPDAGVDGSAEDAAPADAAEDASGD